MGDLDWKRNRPEIISSEAFMIHDSTPNDGLACGRTEKFGAEKDWVRRSVNTLGLPKKSWYSKKNVMYSVFWGIQTMSIWSTHCADNPHIYGANMHMISYLHKCTDMYLPRQIYYFGMHTPSLLPSHLRPEVFWFPCFWILWWVMTQFVMSTIWITRTWMCTSVPAVKWKRGITVKLRNLVSQLSTVNRLYPWLQLWRKIKEKRAPKKSRPESRPECDRRCKSSVSNRWEQRIFLEVQKGDWKKSYLYIFVMFSCW